MQNLCFLLEVGLEKNFVGFSFGFAEDDGPSVASTIEIYYIGNDSIAMIIRAVEGEVFDSFRAADFGVFDEIDELAIGRQIGS
jgi:hypothetical protein